MVLAFAQRRAAGGAFTAPLVCDRKPVEPLVLLSGMVPMPGEPPGDWWGNTGWTRARDEQNDRDVSAPDDENALFLHDVPPALAAQVPLHSRDQSMRNVVSDRLGPVPDEIVGGHCVPLSRTSSVIHHEVR